MKIFSKCSVILFCLMLFFGNNDSCHGEVSEYLLSLSKTAEFCANQLTDYEDTSVMIIFRRAIFGGVLGHNIYKKMGNGNFHIYTSNLQGLHKFIFFGISYKIDNMFNFNFIEFNFISLIVCGIIGQCFHSASIYKFDKKGWMRKIFAFIFLLKRGCHFLTLSINIDRYFCLNIEILGFIVDYLISYLCREYILR